MSNISEQHETVTSQAVDRIRWRRFCIHQAMLNEHAGDLYRHPELLANPNAALTDTKVDKVEPERLRDYPVAGTAINAANNALEAEELDRERRIAQAQAYALEARNVSTN